MSTSRKTIPRCSLSLPHSTKASIEASPIKAEKHDHFINGIPEEDEEVDDEHEDADQDEEEEEHDSEDSLTKKGSYFLVMKKNAKLQNRVRLLLISFKTRFS